MKRIFPIIAFVIFIIVFRFIGSLFSIEDKSAAINVNTPSDQKKFLQIIFDIKKESESTKNDIGKKILIEKRNKELCTFKEKNGESGIIVNNWIGKIDQIEVYQSSPPRITIALDKNITLIDGGLNTNLNSIASTLRVGDSIRFSGKIFSDRDINDLNCSSVKEYIKQGYFTKETLAEFELKEQISAPIFGIEMSNIKLDQL